MKFVFLSSVAAALCLSMGAACAGTVNESAVVFLPDGKGGHVIDPSALPADGSKQNAKKIQYRGGPLLNSPNGVNVYYIWYGNWSADQSPAILADFAQHLGGSPYWNINTTYYDKSKVYVQNKVALAGQAVDNYSQGKALSDSAILSVVNNAISSGALPMDTNALYFVLTSADVNETSGFCTSYCGWHNHANVSGNDVKYSFVGNPARCPTACSIQSTGPNGSSGADGMASVIAHELEETVTDEDLNAWFFLTGQENADKCAWTFGTEYKAANGALANMKLGSRDYLIQQNWVNQGKGKCAVSF
jgi:hypothetical protein